MISVSCFHVFIVNNWGKFPGSGILARFCWSGGRGLELSFCPGGGEFTHQKNCPGILPGGLVRLGIDWYIRRKCVLTTFNGTCPGLKKLNISGYTPIIVHHWMAMICNWVSQTLPLPTLRFGWTVYPLNSLDVTPFACFALKNDTLSRFQSPHCRDIPTPGGEGEGTP